MYTCKTYEIPSYAVSKVKNATITRVNHSEKMYIY